MDFSESTKIVFNRIKKLEPEFANKIVGYLLLHVDNGDRKMIRLAFSPDNVIHSIINKVKFELGLVPTNQPPFPQNAPPAETLPTQFTSWNSQAQNPDSNVEFCNQSYADPVSQENYLQLHNQMQLLSLDDQVDFPVGNQYYPRFPLPGSGLSELPSKVCHYFSKGFCKHGSSCRYLHGNPNEGFNEDQLFSPRSLEKLEFELTELLRLRNGAPVSIALLPMLYYDKYGRTLQAEGYLTESQRHGKAGYSLTKLLARLRPSIHIIERAHGQHSVILAEDLPKYLDYSNEQTEHGCVPIGARQIYLTFPAESVFTEQEVSNYFNGFGPVQDVRIPCQQKRMFGFVTFLFAETVRKILAKGNPHFICGARVLVKPYREKSRLAERKNAERKHAAYSSLQFVDGDPNIPTNSAPRACNGTGLVRKQFVEEQEQELQLDKRLSEFQSVPQHLASSQACNGTRLVRKQFVEEQEQELQLDKRLSEFQSVPQHLASSHSTGYLAAGLNINDEAYDEQMEFPTPERFSFLLDILKDESTSEERDRCTSSAYNDQESHLGLDLPESPFANSRANNISTIT